MQVRLDSDGAIQIWSTARAFLAKLSSGTYIAWGNAGSGADLSGVQVRLDSEGADQIWSTGYAFLAELGLSIIKISEQTRGAPDWYAVVCLI